MLVVVDTNLALKPFTDGLDLVGELQRLLGDVEPVLASSVRDELEHLATGDGARARAAQGALRLAASWRPESTPLRGDDGVLDVARRLGAAVATDDRRLQAECARSGCQVVLTRGHGLDLRLT